MKLKVGLKSQKLTLVGCTYTTSISIFIKIKTEETLSLVPFVQQNIYEFILHMIDTTLLESKDWLSVIQNRSNSCERESCCSYEQSEEIARRRGVVIQDAKQLSCDVCLKTFSRQDILLRYKQAHGGVKYNCPQCNKSFSREDILKTHSLIHSGEKPHRCTHCNCEG